MYISRTNIIEHIPEFEADIVLVCCAEYPNYGDELLLKSWLDNIFLRDSKIKVLVECPVPGNCSVLLGDYDGRVRYQDAVWKIVWGAPHCPIDAFNYGIKLFEACDKNNGLRFMFGHYKKAKLMHFIGGGFIRKGWDNHFSLLGLAIAIKKRFHLNLSMSGQGFCPIDEVFLPIFKTALENFEHVSCRDLPSLKVVEKLSCVDPDTVVDDTFLISDSPLFSGKENQKERVVICIQNDIKDSFISALLLRQIHLLLAEDPERELVVAEFCPNHDLTCVSEISQLFKSPTIISFEKLWNGRVLNKSDICVGTRYHFHLIASRGGCRGIFGSPDAYYGIKHDSLLPIGSNWQNVDLYHDRVPPLCFPRIQEESLVRKKRAEFGLIMSLTS